MNEEPKHGDKRVREGRLETYVVPTPVVRSVERYSGDLPMFEPTPGWDRRNAVPVEGARTVRIYSTSFAYHLAEIMLAPNERIISVETMGGGGRLAWIEQEL